MPKRISIIAAGAFALALLVRSAPASGAITNPVSISLGAPVNSVDWSSDGRFVAAGVGGGSTQLKIVAFTNAILNSVASAALANNCHSARWHPTLNYVATAAGADITGSGSLWIHHFTEPSTLTMTTNVPIAANPAFAVAWRPSGGQLAAGIQRATGELVVYTFSGGGFSTSITQDMSGSGFNIQPDALDWNPLANSNLAVGLEYPSSAPEELSVYRFRGADLQLASEVACYASVRGINWSPSNNYLAVGLSGGADFNHIKIYNFTPSSAVLSQRVSLAEAQDVYAMDWSPAGNLLAVGLAFGVGSEFRVYRYDPATNGLSLLASFETNQAVNSVRWSPDGQSIAIGDGGGFLTVYKVLYSDLGVTKTASTNRTRPGSNLVYTVVATNIGPDAALSFQLTDTLPTNVTIVSVSNNWGTVTTNGNVLTCTTNRMNAYTSLTMRITVTVNATAFGRLTNRVEVSSGSADSVPANNVATCFTDLDYDGDGQVDTNDNCVFTWNQNQADADADHVGDVCDNCTNVHNSDQLDSDTDTVGNACDDCPYDWDPLQEDTDGDGIGDSCDNCISIYNPDQANADGDAFGDLCDNCPYTNYSLQDDSDGDGIGNICDNCINSNNPSQLDTDGDGDGDVCDPDIDGDGIPNEWEILYFGGSTNAIPGTDSDTDRFSNLQEYLADTNPTNDASYFHVAEFLNAAERLIFFQSSTGRSYTLQQTTNVLRSGPWDSGSPQMGSGDMMSLGDSAEFTTRVYRIRVTLP